MSMEGPLAGRTVVVTRRQVGETAELLTAAGARVEHLPAIALAPPEDPAPLARLVSEQSTYDDLVFTSATAVRAFVEAAAAQGVPTFGSARLIAVGTATARTIERAGGEVAVVGSGGAARLIEQLGSATLAGRRMALPRAEEGREEFPDAARAAGATLEVVIAYRTLLHPVVGEGLLSLLCAGEVFAVCFASPSAVEAVASGMGSRAGEAFGRFTSVAIGETTSEALRAFGIDRIVVAAEPSAEALARAVIGLARP